MLTYQNCSEHPTLKGTLDCEECREAMHEGRESLRRFALLDPADDKDAFDDAELNAVLARIGWRTSRSVMPGRKRVYDEGGLWLNVYSRDELWAVLRERGYAGEGGGL